MIANDPSPRAFTTHELEIIQEALTNLGLSLTEVGYHWSQQERRIFNRALALIDRALQNAA